MKKLKLGKTRPAVLMAGVISILSIMPVTSASAAVAAFDCSSWTSSATMAHARCNLGLGGVRVWADCYSLSTGLTLRKYGDWKPVGQISSVACFSTTFVVNHGYQTS